MRRRELECIVERSLAKVDLELLVARALSRRRAKGRVRVLAIGKAASRMAAGALRGWGEAIDEVVVVTTAPTQAPNDPRVRVILAAHPLPDGRSLRAGAQCFEVARACAGDRATLLVLVSGGASALVCAPAPGVRLADKRRVTQAMLASGASIQDINVVRKHVSTIKGGGLARAAAPASVITLVASDVIGGGATDVGSGPSVADRSRVADARRLLRRHAPRFVGLELARTGAAPNAKLPVLLASPEALARVVQRELTAKGLKVRRLPPSQASITVLASEYHEIASTLAANSAVVRVAEPSVVVPSRSERAHGGRSTHLATLVGRALPPGVTFMAAATDGVDGTSGTAGAIVDASFRAVAGVSSIDEAIARFDTGALHLRVGTARALRPSGQNLADLHVLVRAPSRRRAR